MKALFFSLLLAVTASAQTDPVRVVVDALASHDVVLLSEEHYGVQFHGFAHQLLADARHLEGADKEAADLWRWHAVEEIEHKGVAYDTWLHATRHWTRWKRWKVKAKVMLYITRNFVVDRTAGALDLMRQDGVTGLRAWAKLLSYLWVRPGMFRKIAGAWVRFFLPGFHPWNEDDRELVAAYEASVASAPETKRKVRRAL